MTQALRACGNASRTCFGEAGSRLWRHSVGRCTRLSTAFHGRLYLAVLLLLAACGCSQHSSPARNVSAGTTAVADFAGTAAAITPASSCPQILSPDLRNPFSAGPPPASPADYRLVGCWQGTLEGNTFVLAEYFSSELGGGIAVEYRGALVAHLMTGTSAPVVVRFTGENVCIAEKAGAYFEAVNLRTGSRMDDEAAQRACPPTEWPPAYVLGLGDRHYPVDWHSTNPR